MTITFSDRDSDKDGDGDDECSSDSDSDSFISYFIKCSMPDSLAVKIFANW